MHRRFLIVFAALAAIAVLAACSTTQPTEPQPAVETAGFEYPAPPDDGDALRREEMEEAREMNRKLREQVEELKEAVDAALTEEPAGEPETAPETAARAEPEPIPEPTLSPTGLRGALLGAGISDLEVGTNPEGETYVLLPGALSFASGRARLEPEARAQLAKLAGVLAASAPDARLRVEGHTDSDPIKKSHWGTNQKLSEARAKAVASFLVTTGGWSSDLVVSRGFGARMPIASNDSKAGKARNRRVEIVIE